MTIRTLLLAATLAAALTFGAAPFVPVVSANCGAMGGGSGCKQDPPPPDAIVPISWMELSRIIRLLFP
jgi:hypothetical protein